MDAINLYISEYLENNNIDKAIELVKKYAELNNKIVNKKLLKEDIVNCILQYISKNNKIMKIMIIIIYLFMLIVH